MQQLLFIIEKHPKYFRFKMPFWIESPSRSYSEINFDDCLSNRFQHILDVNFRNKLTELFALIKCKSIHLFLEQNRPV